MLKASGIHLLFYLKFIRIANRLIFVNNLHAGNKKKGSLLQVNADFSLKKLNAGSKEWEGKSDFARKCLLRQQLIRLTIAIEKNGC